MNHIYIVIEETSFYDILYLTITMEFLSNAI